MQEAAMVTIGSLWLPILVSSVLVFIASAIVWMALPHHNSDYHKLPDEEAARAALGQDLAPGMYTIPYAESQDDMKDPEVQRKMAEGPVGLLTVGPKGAPPMGKNMLYSFLFNIVVAGTVAYVASRTLGRGEEYWHVFQIAGTVAWVAYVTTRTLAPGTDYLRVFQIAGTVAWLAYGFAVVQDAIWFWRPWKSVVKHLADALLYAVLIAGVFGWRWPDM